MKKILVLCCFVYATLLAPGRARACGDFQNAGPYIAAIYFAYLSVPTSFAVADLSFAIYDTVKAAQGKRPTLGAAIAEVSVAGTELALSLGLIAVPSYYLYFGLPFTLASSGLLAHGIWAIATDHKYRPAPAGRRPALSTSLSHLLVPLPCMVGAGRDAVPGLAWGGRF